MSTGTHPHAVKTSIPLKMLTQLSELIEMHIGLYFPSSRLNDMLRGIGYAAVEFGFTDVRQCIEWLLSSPLLPSQVQTIAAHLTIGETYFFRDKPLFKICETHILPQLITTRRNRQLRIWSAGCASGEEPYSLAILLASMLDDLDSWNITLLATDISSLVLQKGVQGRYGEWSFRDTPRSIRLRWFDQCNRTYTVVKPIKKMVTFSSLNLARDVYPAIINNTNAMDIIFCRNVLMYFSRKRAVAVIERLARCLVDGGWLAIGPVEGPGPQLPPLLEPVSFDGTILYRKKPQPLFVSPKKQAHVPSVPVSLKPHPSPLPQQTNAQPTSPPAAKCAPLPEQTSTDIGTTIDHVRLLANRGELANSLALCTQSLQNDKLNSALYYLQATILQEMHRPDEAETALKRAIYIDQDFALAHFSLGHLLRQRGKKKESQRHLQTARTLLKDYDEDAVLPEGEGMSAGRLIELINRMEATIS